MKETLVGFIKCSGLNGPSASHLQSVGKKKKKFQIKHNNQTTKLDHTHKNSPCIGNGCELGNLGSIQRRRNKAPRFMLVRMPLRRKFRHSRRSLSRWQRRRTVGETTHQSRRRAGVQREKVPGLKQTPRRHQKMQLSNPTSSASSRRRIPLPS